MRMFGLKELAGENFWQRLPLFIWGLNIHSAQHADFGLPVPRLLAAKSKGSSTGIDLHFFWSSLKTFLSCFFPPWPIFLWWFIFLFFFFPKGQQRAQALPQLGFPTLVAHLCMVKPGPHLGANPSWTTSLPSPSQDQGMLWKLQRQKEKSNTHWNTWCLSTSLCETWRVFHQGFMAYLFMSLKKLLSGQQKSLVG